jgi:hypothetical protein
VTMKQRREKQCNTGPKPRTKDLGEPLGTREGHSFPTGSRRNKSC